MILHLPPPKAEKRSRLTSVAPCYRTERDKTPTVPTKARPAIHTSAPPLPSPGMKGGGEINMASGYDDYIVFAAAWRLLESELKKYDQGAHSFEEFVDRLTQNLPTPKVTEEAQHKNHLAETGRFLTCAEAAKYLGVCRKSVEIWARTKKIASFRRGRCVRIPESAIAALVSGQQEMPNNQAPKKEN